MLKLELVVWKVKEWFQKIEEKSNGHGEQIKTWKADTGDASYK